MSSDRDLLLRIADAMEQWPTMPRDVVGLIGQAPADVLVYIVNRQISDPVQQRAISKVVPTLNTNDFAEAARQIRERAKALPLTDDEIREIVRTKLADGTLPRELPQMTGGSGHTQYLGTFGSERVDPCSVCDRGGTTATLNLPGGAVSFHERCHRIWREEAEKPW